MKKYFATLLIAASAYPAWAGGLESLETFVKTVTSGRAEFSQVVTAPAKDGQAARSKTSTGTFEFSRPNRFRFIYKKPFEQSIVADGQTLWLYDTDLNQVTSRKQSSVLGSTPAALIAAAPDLRACRPISRWPTRRMPAACNGWSPRPRAKTASCSLCAWVFAQAKNPRGLPRLKSSTALVSVRC
jgi:hypothetical protein